MKQIENGMRRAAASVAAAFGATAKVGMAAFPDIGGYIPVHMVVGVFSSFAICKCEFLSP